ncbi:chemotaxis-specific protein-glutamate methyltransferase CheB [Novosphingobium sp.]|uniref:chemotaxis-specific protein-glutamate methyltransferase CheB n=1 Tax=Novosphingobium sp. TaxID=1874826 RepID=UPI0025DA8DB0|nr:chemotaxis-specific protein-glutamate methyltransferase CheB [Novosphingobium sp.]MCC6924872.1 chemotaxis-specific protein-glutamate methyltransferase CheB [Novosphingobium sp.]
MATNPISSDAAPASGGGIRVFIVDDSSLVRAVFSRLIEAEPGLELAGVATTAEDAISQLGSLHVHVILLDLEMPGMGGMQALPQITRLAGSAKVLVVSSLTEEGAVHSIQALAAGAADTLLKPEPGGFDQAYRERLVARIRALGRRPLRRAEGDPKPAAPAVAIRPSPAGFRARIVAIGASTGGVQATGMVLAQLPAELGVPILITQHLPPMFTDAYAGQLQEISGRKVLVARDGMPLVADQIFLAPGDAHLCLKDGKPQPGIKLDRKVSSSGYVPSVDRMFESLAKVYRDGAMGVVLTGMGRDGTEGAQALIDAGSAVVVQNEVSSVVWGMPGSIAKAGLASAVLHPRDIATRIALCAKAD